MTALCYAQMPAGRPRLLSSPEEFEDRAESYFAEREAADRPITITGLALAVGLSGREALAEYGRRPEYSDVVKRAKSRVEAGYEERLAATAAAGSIFALKNFGWTDRQDVNVNGGLSITLTRSENAL